MIRASDKNWNSPTTLYIARRLEEIAQGRRIAVLDLGCGAGVIMKQLLEYGYDLYGYDFPRRRESLKEALGDYFGDRYDDHIRITPDERTIPFDANQFDVIYASQVFEHVKFLDSMMAECARVLKKDGIFLTNFPVATRPTEGHLGLPFAHWLPPGKLRRCYLYPFYLLRLARRPPNLSTRRVVEVKDDYLRDHTFYRFINEILHVGDHYFESCEIETEHFIRAKLDLMACRKSILKRALAGLIRIGEGPLLTSLVTHGFNSAFRFSHPRK